jgi:hypothetical protein
LLPMPLLPTPLMLLLLLLLLADCAVERLAHQQRRDDSQCHPQQQHCGQPYWVQPGDTQLQL